MTSGSPEICVGSVVLHHRREDGRVVLERYTVKAVRGGQAVLSRRGQRTLARVEIDTLLSSPAWAIQGALW